MNDKIKKLIIIGGILVAVVVFALTLITKKTEDGAMLNFVGEDYKQVKFFANQYGLDLVITREDSPKYAVDEVISQSIPEGKVVNKGERLEIVVSNGW